jgi:hypothetical protein
MGRLVSGGQGGEISRAGDWITAGGVVGVSGGNGAAGGRGGCWGAVQKPAVARWSSDYPEVVAARVARVLPVTDSDRNLDGALLGRR